MSENKVLASVNGKDITSQDVYQFLNQLDPRTAAQFSSPEGINQIANELVNQELLYLEALKNGLDEEDNFKEELEKVKVGVLKQYAINKLFTGITVSDEEISKFYDENKQYFQKPEAARASHILVDDEQKANEVLAEIDGGLSFEEAASKYSNCPSKANGGDLGEFTRGKMVPEFEEVAFSMEEGKISQPVKSQFGYHLIKLNYRKESSISPLEEVKDQINQQLILMKQQERYLDKTEELKKDFKVETYF
ncbi:peptidylprolyl isomerase [Clostridium sp. Cult3]|uniref:peptidylprolyl isomerase n=1 Tax=Clostridium sp. Cult3 TaxID=2079004 RepID=UPI001F3F4E73|nr:peptidylprolyl isomerase [Clostridium sp. Cult3]MCF6461592.1 peptidylprolyl isomerase [Clostridium sp. Cult3]